MPIPFTCPHCGTTTNVDEQYAGRSGPCAKCGKTITIPAASGAAYAVPAPRSSGWPIAIVIMAVALFVVPILGVLVALLLPAVQSAREAARRTACANNVKQINLALLCYQDVHGTFPPAYTVDANGRPLHSWRVLILPYMEEKGLYNQFRLNEPWDSPHNRALVYQMPNIFRCPSDVQSQPNETSYVLLTGQGTLFEADKAASPKDKRVNPSSLVTVVEAAGSKIGWTEPRDLDVKQLGLPMPGLRGQGAGSGHPGTITVGFADGSVRRVEQSTDLRTLLGPPPPDEIELDDQ